MGRKPIPFQLVDNSKMFLKKGELNKREELEIKNKSKKFTCPKHLSLGAKKEWKKIVKLYKNLEIDILNDMDTTALEIYCESLITYRNALSAIRKGGEIVINPQNGKTMRNPWFDVMEKASNSIKIYGGMLLLDPISRAKVGTVSAKHEKDKLDGDPMEELLKRGGRR